METSKKCVIPNCKNPLAVIRKLIKAQKKGFDSLIRASVKRGHSLNIKEDSAWVHAACRKKYTCARRILKAEILQKAETPTPSAPTTSKLRSTGQYSLRGSCLFCEEIIPNVQKYNDEQSKNRKTKKNPIHMITGMKFRDKIVEQCSRLNDDESKRLHRRIAHIADLVTAGAMYHRKCYQAFKLKRTVTTQSRAPGRPMSEDVDDAMRQIFDKIKSSEKRQFSMTELLDGIEGYRPSEFTVKMKLREKYGDGVCIKSIQSKSPAVCFRSTDDKILTQHWYENRLFSKKQERLRIVRTAAEIVLEDIRSQAHDRSQYPPCVGFLDNVDHELPESLKIFLEGLKCSAACTTCHGSAGLNSDNVDISDSDDDDDSV